MCFIWLLPWRWRHKVHPNIGTSLPDYMSWHFRGLFSWYSWSLELQILSTQYNVINFRISISSVTEPPSSTWAPLITMRTDASARPAPAHCLPTAWRSVNYRLESAWEFVVEKWLCSRVILKSRQLESSLGKEQKKKDIILNDIDVKVYYKKQTKFCSFYEPPPSPLIPWNPCIDNNMPNLHILMKGYLICDFSLSRTFDFFKCNYHVENMVPSVILRAT